MSLNLIAMGNYPKSLHIYTEERCSEEVIYDPIKASLHYNLLCNNVQLNLEERVFVQNIQAEKKSWKKNSKVPIRRADRNKQSGSEKMSTYLFIY